MSTPSAKPDYVALGALALTIGIHVVLKLMSEHVNPYFISGTLGFWLAFVVCRAWQSPHVLVMWGFTTKNLRRTARACFAIGLCAVVAMFGYGLTAGTISVTPRTLLHLALTLMIYPAWGIIQQFLALGLLVNNVERLPVLRERNVAITFLCATLFGLVHFYDWRLAAATFVFELVVIPVFRVYRNAWPIGFLQGWVGAFFYLWVLNEDLIERALG